MYRTLFAVATIAAVSFPAFGNITVDIGTSTSGTSVANSLKVTTTDYGWNGAQLLVQLTQGSVINLDAGLGGVDTAPTSAEIGSNPSRLFDTYVGRVDQSDFIFGGAVELGGAGPWSLGPAGINVDWFGSTGTHAPSNQLPIANLVFSDDAQGTWSVRLSEPFLQTVTLLGGTLADGVLLTDFVPGDLNIDGFTGIEDLNIVLGQWNTDGSGDPRSDPSGDNFVGIEDLNFVLGPWNSGTPQQFWPEDTTADLDGDGFVGIADFNLLFNNWNQNVTPGDLLAGDPSGDGFVGFDDLVIVHALWHTGTPPIAVPEPAGVLCLTAGGWCLLRSRRA